MNKKAQQDITRKLRVLNHAKETGNVSKTCRYFDISRETRSISGKEPTPPWENAA